MGDHDTHRGQRRGDGVVSAQCGITFIPRPTLRITGPPPGQLAGAGPALPGYPPDPDQVCPDCQRNGGAR